MYANMQINAKYDVKILYSPRSSGFIVYTEYLV